MDIGAVYPIYTTYPIYPILRRLNGEREKERTRACIAVE